MAKFIENLSARAYTPICSTGIAGRWRLFAGAGWVSLSIVMGLLLGPWASAEVADSKVSETASMSLEDISFSSLPGDEVRIKLGLSAPPPRPTSFTTSDPARIILDFPNTALKLSRKTQTVELGTVKSINAVEAQGRTRVVLNLVRPTPYKTRVEGNDLYLTLEGAAKAETVAKNTTRPSPAPSSRASSSTRHSLTNVDFRRGEKGEGRVVVSLSDPDASVDVREEAGRILVDFRNSHLPERLARRLDVMDFATPVKTVETSAQGNDVHMVISTLGDYEQLTYQSDNTFTIEVQPVTKEQAAAKKVKPNYSGEKLSLNFQNIEVRAVLQLIADFTGLNIVTSDTVQGNLTLRLKDVPWDQALDIILQAKGLGMRRSGNVIQVAPLEEIAAREKQELDAKEATPVRSELFRVNYAKAADLATLLKAKENSLLSARGNVTVDERTNTLLVQDTEDKLAEMRRLIGTLDVPMRQVLIESRVVIANNDFSKELGVRFGTTTVARNGDNGIVTTTGSLAGANNTVASAVENAQGTGDPFPVEIPSNPQSTTGQGAQASNIPRNTPVLPSPDNRLNVNLPVASSNAGRIALAILGANYLLDLELSALQAEGRGEVLSNPRVITSNEREAVIEQGTEIPFLEASSSGATSITFKKAVLSLRVKPHITPDDRIIMDLNVTKDAVGQTILLAGSAVPSIDTREVATQVLVNNGETIVLGGVYEQTSRNDSDRVPLLSDIPYLGALFRQTRKLDNKSELLIFVTPKIVKDALSLGNP